MLVPDDGSFGTLGVGAEGSLGVLGGRVGLGSVGVEGSFGMLGAGAAGGFGAGGGGREGAGTLGT